MKKSIVLNPKEADDLEELLQHNEIDERNNYIQYLKDNGYDNILDKDVDPAALLDKSHVYGAICRLRQILGN